MLLVLFCDYGLDDAVATIDALSHASGDGYTGAALVAVGGNVPADVALKNAKKLVAHLKPDLPVVIVDTTAEEQPSEYLSAIHGGDGMGDLLPASLAEGPAPVVPFAAWAEALGGTFDLLSLGPMTLVPRVLGKRPRKFIFMGGNIAEEPNFHGYEFNHAKNRAAFSECVKYPHVAVTMDTCRHPLFNIQPQFEGEGEIARFVARTRELTFSSGERGCYVWDDIAVKYLRHPAWFSTYRAADRDGNILNVAKYIGKKRYAEILHA